MSKKKQRQKKARQAANVVGRGASALGAAVDTFFGGGDSAPAKGGKGGSVTVTVPSQYQAPAASPAVNMRDMALGAGLGLTLGILFSRKGS